jgi:hypothetical protein
MTQRCLQRGGRGFDKHRVMGMTEIVGRRDSLLQQSYKVSSRVFPLAREDIQRGNLHLERHKAVFLACLQPVSSWRPMKVAASIRLTRDPAGAHRKKFPNSELVRCPFLCGTGPGAGSTRTPSTAHRHHGHHCARPKPVRRGM